MTTDELMERQEKLRQARNEFNAIFGSQLLHAELAAWKFFLRGKGLKA